MSSKTDTRNVGDTERIFKDMKRQVNNRLGIDLLGTHTIAKKTKSAPLMVSDFLAYTYLQMRTSKVDYAANAPMNVPKGQAGLTFLELLPDSMRMLKEQIERDRTSGGRCVARAAGNHEGAAVNVWEMTLNEFLVRQNLVVVDSAEPLLEMFQAQPPTGKP